MRSLKLPRRATFFGTSNDGDLASKHGSQDLVAPLAGELEQHNWRLEVVPPAKANKARLGSVSVVERQIELYPLAAITRAHPEFI